MGTNSQIKSATHSRTTSLGYVHIYTWVELCSCIATYIAGLKVSRMTHTIWVTLLVGKVGFICKLNYLDVTQIFNRSHVLWKKTLAPDKWVNLGLGECTEPSLVWNQLTTLSCFEACGVQRFHSQEFCVWDQFCILKKSMALFHIWYFSCHFT